MAFDITIFQDLLLHLTPPNTPLHSTALIDYMSHSLNRTMWMQRRNVRTKMRRLHITAQLIEHTAKWMSWSQADTNHRSSQRLQFQMTEYFIVLPWKHLYSSFLFRKPLKLAAVHKLHLLASYGCVWMLVLLLQSCAVPAQLSVGHNWWSGLSVDDEDYLYHECLDTGYWIHDWILMPV